ncbi:MAG: rutB 2 [Caulobacteraceae bacterium]|nr:rutB 2 [Caulobacteraceae bacterium]
MSKLSAILPPVHRLSPVAGAIHSLDDPRKVALIVVDMQNFFVEAGQPLFGTYAPGVIAPIQGLIAAVRAGGGGVVWLRQTWSDQPGKAAPRWADDLRGARRVAQVRALSPGTHAHAIYSAFQVAPADLVIDKYRFSAFTPDHAGLDATLRARGIDTVIVAGVLTNFCCQSTARDAMMLDYRVLMPPDASAAADDRLHNATLVDLGNMGQFDLRTTPGLIAELERATISGTR